MELVKQIEKMPMAEISLISETFFKSGMFVETKSAAQAMVKILAGQEIGIPPFASMSGIHIIQGKPTIGAGLIASRVKGSGKYDYIVTEMNEKICSIDFIQGGKVIGNSTFTVEDAKKAGTKNIDKFPKNMLFARCISNGVKWFCPDVFSGPVYVPEEMTVVTEDITHSVVVDNSIRDNDNDAVEAISKLSNCYTIEDLTMLKETLEDNIIKNKIFIKAATNRFKEINEKPEKEAVVS